MALRFFRTVVLLAGACRAVAAGGTACCSFKGTARFALFLLHGLRAFSTATLPFHLCLRLPILSAMSGRFAYRLVLPPAAVGNIFRTWTVLGFGALVSALRAL